MASDNLDVDIDTNTNDFVVYFLSTLFILYTAYVAHTASIYALQHI